MCRLLILTFICVVLVACTPNSHVESATVAPDTPAGTGTVANDTAGLPNPASVYCEEQGYKVEMRAGEGGTYGVCLFPDGSECDEWAYYRGECRPGDSLATSAATPGTLAPAEDGWQIFRNETLSYTFQFPAGAIIEPDNDPRLTVVVRGPLVDDEYWPMLSVSHPSDLEIYRPPEGVDLAEWLVTNNMILPAGEEEGPESRLEDVQIAGITAVHTRFERSPQSYAFDKYFFTHTGQLFTIVILHTGDREDWELYNHFLESFQFESGG